MKRVIFDRSIFHGPKFDRLKSSSLSAKIDSRQIQLIYTVPFIEETLQYCLINPLKFKNHWNFIVSVNTSKWFHLAEDIISFELGNNIVGRKYFLRSKNEIQKILGNVPELISGNVPIEEYQQAKEEMVQNNLTRIEFRKQRLELRKIVPIADYDFNKYYENNIEWYIENGLMKYHSNSENYLSVWKKSRSKCRFTESFTRGWFSSLYVPLMDHQLKVDTNDRTDAEQLSYLEWGDIFVSDDLKFMKKAFDLLYGKSLKQFMTSNQFIDFIND